MRFVDGEREIKAVLLYVTFARWGLKNFAEHVQEWTTTS